MTKRHLAASFSVLSGLLALSCAPPPMDPPAARANDCPERRLLGRHAYALCESDSFWHVVTDSSFCVPSGGLEVKRTFDRKTDDRCTPREERAFNPTLVDELLKRVLAVFAPLDGSCQAPVAAGEVTLQECVATFWEVATYQQYDCLDGSHRTARPAIRSTRITVDCTRPPPPLFQSAGGTVP